MRAERRDVWICAVMIARDDGRRVGSCSAGSRWPAIGLARVRLQITCRMLWRARRQAALGPAAFVSELPTWSASQEGFTSTSPHPPPAPQLLHRRASCRRPCSACCRHRNAAHAHFAPGSRRPRPSRSHQARRPFTFAAVRPARPAPRFPFAKSRAHHLSRRHTRRTRSSRTTDVE